MHGMSGLCVYMVCVVCAYAWCVWSVRMFGVCVCMVCAYVWCVCCMRIPGVCGVSVCMVCVVYTYARCV